jgi:hypothetical protein
VHYSRSQLLAKKGKGLRNARNDPLDTSQIACRLFAGGARRAVFLFGKSLPELGLRTFCTRDSAALLTLVSPKKHATARLDTQCSG